MVCEGNEEQISAWLDGELTTLEEQALQRHLATCDACAAYAGRSEALHRSMRLSAIDEVPDLVAAIVAAAPRQPRHVVEELMRYALGVLAATQLLLAIPELFARSTNESVHVARHLGGWDLAFAVGLLVVAMQPWRARGLLPMVAALAGVMAVTAVFDMLNHQAAGLGEASHVFELAGLALVWLIARSDRRRSGGRDSHRGPDLQPRNDGARARMPLRVVQSLASHRSPAGAPLARAQHRPDRRAA